MNISSFLIGYQAGKKAGGGSSADVRYVTFKSRDGTVEYGKKAVAYGDDCADPIARGIFATPTEESTAQFHFTHDYWATEPNGATDPNALKAVTEDRVVYATYISALRSYTITFHDGDTVLDSKEWVYGSTPSCTPTKDGYSFDGWSPAVAAVTGDADYYAQWIEKVTFAAGSWADIARIAEAGEAARYFKVGEKRNITCNGKTYEVEIVGIGCDTLADGSRMAGISCMTTGVYTYTSRYHSSNSNSIYWQNCELRTYCNGTIYDGLETELKKVIKEVQKTSFYNSGGKTTNDFCWVPSAGEIGHILWGGLDSIYPVFSSSVDATINGKSYHVRDVNINTNFSYYKSGDYADKLSNGNMTDYRYVRFGFCI